jgi:hypothetical protein
MRVTIEGTVEKVGEVETIKQFLKRELWIKVDKDTKYPQTVSIEFTQKNVARLNLVNEGDDVIVEADLRGREWKGKVFNSLNGWKCVIEAPKPPVAETNEENASERESAFAGGDFEDDEEDDENLPF